MVAARASGRVLLPPHPSACPPSQIADRDGLPQTSDRLGPCVATAQRGSSHPSPSALEVHATPQPIFLSLLRPALRARARRALRPSFISGRWRPIAHLCEAMFMVLVHPYGALSPGLFRPTLFQLLPRLLFYLSVFLAVTTIPAVTAQNFTSPTPTEGLSILDSPAPNAYVQFPPESAPMC